MNPIIGGALIGAAGSFAGGFMGADEARSNRHEQRMINAQNIAHQKEFAQHGVRWKVEDAKRAGVHPLYALGASTTSFTPSSVGSGPDNSMSSAVSNMGQDIGRAVGSMRSKQEKLAADLNIMGAKLDLEGKAIDNQIRASQLKKLNSTGTGPGLPSATDNSIIPGQGEAVRVQPAQPTASQRGRAAQEAGAINSYGYHRTDGGYGIVPSKDMKERIEDDFIAEVMWHMKNRLNPAPPDTQSHPIPPDMRKRGYRYWFWNPFKQEFVPSKNP